MEKLILEVKQLKKGFEYIVKKSSGKIIETRKSERTYVAASVFVSTSDSKIYEVAYHGRIDLIGKGSCSCYMASSHLRYLGVATINNQ